MMTDHDHLPDIGHESDDDLVERLIASMTPSEKAAQMAQVELGSITPDEVAAWSIGSVLSGGGGNPGDGSARAWRDSVDSFVEGSRRSRLGIPILYGTDAVHGHNNVLGATIFPHHIGLGATGDADLVRDIARAAALETAATGARWTFAPCLAVPGDIRWGRTYEGFGQRSDLVGRLGRAAIEGWHGDDLPATGVIACANHFVGEGAMVWRSAGSHRHPWIRWWDGWGNGWQIDQGDVDLDEEALRRDHLAPFVEAIDAGVLTVMAAYNSWNGTRCHAHRRLLTEVLKDELGFGGFVVSDWMAVDQLDADYTVAVELAVNAGVDMVMLPFDAPRFVSIVTELVEAERITTDRVDDAVRRILRVKCRMRLLEHLRSSTAPVVEATPVPLEVVGCEPHRNLARRAASASAVALVETGVLPVPQGASVLTAGEAVDDIGLACGGWTISWTGAPGPITTGTTILDGLRRLVGTDRVFHDTEAEFDGRRAPYGIVTVHEPPYVEGHGDREFLDLPDDQIDIVRRVRGAVDHLVVLVVSGRPLLVESIIGMADAIVACWLPGSEADGIAELLTGDSPFVGRLPVAWPRSAAQVAGTTDDVSAPPAWPVGHRCPVPTGRPTSNPGCDEQPVPGR
ncbi:MAG: hypothetical protein RLZZ01_345 [Actinomycetota bacterium]